MSDNLWQLYNEQGQPIDGRGVTKSEALKKGILHGAAHVWVWRNFEEGPEILLQKRAAQKRTWPGLLDISAAGHIDLGEEPIEAARREIKEEIGFDATEDDLKFVSCERSHMVGADFIENEFQWLYILRLDAENDFELKLAEVELLVWKKIEQFETDLKTDSGQFVPHGQDYYQKIISAIKLAGGA